MPNNFKHYWPLSSEEKVDVWENGIIVLDTNIYLHIYRFPEMDRNRLIQILENPKITKRLWIPNQVAEEFYRNRLGVISEQVASAKKFLDKVDKSEKLLSSDMDGIVRKHHPLIERENWKIAINKLISSLKDQYEDSLKAYPFTMKDDPFLIKIQNIMDGKIGPPYSSKEMDDIRKSAKERFQNQIPPGYEDAKKDGDRAISDFIIWKQCLVQMKTKKSNMILVLDDIKEDWWLKMQGQLIGPRPELRKEFTENTGKEVDLSTSERFFDWAGDYLDLEKQTSLGEAVREVRKKIRSKRLTFSTVGQGAFLVCARKELDNEDTGSSENIEINKEESVDNMVAWFIKNYEDPANHVPYESKEGGYIYYAGGLYDAEEELQDQFPEATQEDIEKASEIISSYGGPEWVRKEEYP